MIRVRGDKGNKGNLGKGLIFFVGFRKWDEKESACVMVRENCRFYFVDFGLRITRECIY